MSTELCFPGSRSRRWLGAGPLARDLERFASRLSAEGYSHPSAKAKLRLLRNLSTWLEREGLGVDTLDEGRFDAFLRTRAPQGRPRGEAATGRQLLSHLRREGRIAAAPADADGDAQIRRIERIYSPRCG